MKFGRVKATPEAGFDLTPMIDVVLLLIIFFVLSAQFAQAVRRNIDLPKERGESEGNRSDSVILDVEKNGDMYIAGERITEEGLRITLRSYIAQAKGQTENVDLIVRAARDGPAAHLNRVARVLSETGMRNWKLATVDPGSGGGP